MERGSDTVYPVLPKLPFPLNELILAVWRLVVVLGEVQDPPGAWLLYMEAWGGECIKYKMLHMDLLTSPPLNIPPGSFIVKCKLDMFTTGYFQFQRSSD